MDKKSCIELTEAFVKKQLEGAEAGHDWFHIQRVYKTAMYIAEKEKVNTFVVALGALLHDIADPKFHHGDEELGPTIAAEFLESIDLSSEVQQMVIDIIRNSSFKNSLSGKTPPTPSVELQVVQDADRLDAIGAIGIARAFHYGGFKNRLLYDPEIAPDLHMDKETYKRSKSPTINHFYEKLLLLKDRMNTATGKSLAQNRHEYMQGFLNRFYREWEGSS
ncbi:MAG: HD domain-containing protein [Flavobacteriaceae bacterium]